MDAFIALLVAVVMAVGLIGTVLPFLPGLGLIWLAAVAYGITTGFGAVGWVCLAVVTVVGAAGIAAGFVLPHRAARHAGAARISIVLGLLGAIVGFFVVPVVGFPLGGALGIYVAEQVRLHDLRAAGRATWATIVGFGVGSLAQLAAGLAMVGCWAVWVLAG